MQIFCFWWGESVEGEGIIKDVRGAGVGGVDFYREKEFFREGDEVYCGYFY